MKKSILYTTFSVTLLGVAAAGVAGLVLNQPSSAVSNDINLVSTLDNTFNVVKPVATLDDETVYVITDASGNAKTKFIGNSLYTGSEELPFEFHASYFLDGAEISASDLSGKSGHVRIVYDYTSARTFGGKNIPFLAVTGLSLDGSKFSNVKTANGKLVSDKDSFVLLGYAVAGLNENLNTDILPNRFEIEADVSDFELSTVYTVFTNDLFADLDTSKLSDIDSLVRSMNDLSIGLDQLLAGSSELSGGLKTLVEKSADLVKGIGDLKDGLAYLDTFSEDLSSGATSIYDSIVFPSVNYNLSQDANLMYAISAYQIDFPLTLENYQTSIPKIVEIMKSVGATDAAASLEGIQNFYDGLLAYTAGVSDAAAGAAELYSYTPSLVSGVDKLYTGSVTMKDGLETFKTSGIDKLVAFANEDLAGFTSNLRRSVTAASSYHSFGGENANSVKFILKTPSI